MDALLARLFRQSGGELRENQRWGEPGLPEGFVRASGRRLQPSEGGWRWLGLKVHAHGVPLAADLEMHASSNGYIGLCRLGPDEVNVCGLFRRSASAHDSVPPPAALLRGAPGTSAWERLEQATFEEATLCSVAGLCLRPQRAAPSGECRLGDALTLIPPVTGNGMSMAFEAAGLALAPLAAYSRGEIPWARARQLIARTCDTAFARRLAWARWLQWMMFSPLLQGPLGALPLHSAWFWRFLFERTR
jgi:2-polyprenyl-6-methoxyphenol hydroxylase-like FAD-dependent oxidoreductase